MADPTDSGIYEIVNLINDKRYIGSAKCFAQRWHTHRTDLAAGKHHNRHLQASFRRHGEAAFEYRVIEVCALDSLIAREQAHIDARQPEYNIARTAGSTLGVKYTPEGRANVSAALIGKRKGIPRTADSVEKTAAAHRGMKRSPETRAKIAGKMRGKKRPPRDAACRAKISAAHKGRQKSAEHMAALQAGRARRTYTDEQKAAISAKLREGYASGARSRERPPEYRAKIAETLRQQSQSPEMRERLSKQAADAWAERPAEDRRQHMEKVRAARRKA